MPPPSQLAIATSSLNRLIKEESSYGTELTNQRKRVEQLQAGDGGDEEDVGNSEFQLRQEVRSPKLFRLLYLCIVCFVLFIAIFAAMTVL